MGWSERKTFGSFSAEIASRVAENLIPFPASLRQFYSCVICEIIRTGFNNSLSIE